MKIDCRGDKQKGKASWDRVSFNIKLTVQNKNNIKSKTQMQEQKGKAYKKNKEI